MLFKYMDLLSFSRSLNRIPKSYWLVLDSLLYSDSAIALKARKAGARLIPSWLTGRTGVQLQSLALTEQIVQQIVPQVGRRCGVI